MNAWTGTDWIVMELSQTILSVKLAQPESRSKCFDYQPSKTVEEKTKKTTVT